MVRDFSSKISSRRPINIINSVDKTRISIFLRRNSIDYAAFHEYLCVSKLSPFYYFGALLIKRSGLFRSFLELKLNLLEFFSLEMMVKVINFAVKSLPSDGKNRPTVFWVVMMLK